MDLTWVFIISLPILFAPAALGLLAFRLIIPQAKLKQSSDYLFFLPFLVVTMLINLDFIFYYITVNPNLINPKFATLFNQHYPLLTPLKWMEALVIGIKNFFSMLPCKFISASVVTRTTYSFYEFIFELQLRAFFLSGLLALSIKGFFRLDDYYEAFPYYSQKVSKFNKCVVWFGQNILGYELTQDIVKDRLYTNQRGWFSKLTESINIFLTNEWANAVSFNRKIEIIIADIRTVDDHLYSGPLVNFVSSKDRELDAVSIYSPLTYYPESASVSKNKASYSLDKNEISNSTEAKIQNQIDYKKSFRKWRLMDKRGEFYVLSSQILSVNLWYIKKGSKFNDNLFIGENDYIFEKIKWNLILLSEHHDFIDEYKLKITYRDDHELKAFFEKLMTWIDESITNSDNIAKFSIETIKLPAS